MSDSEPTTPELSLEPATRPLKPISDQPELPPDARLMTVSEHLLKHPFGTLKSLQNPDAPMKLKYQLAFLIAAGFLLFGVMVGSVTGGTQLWAAPLKILLGVIYASVICLPSLFIFGALTGSSLNWRASVGGLLAMLALTTALLIAFCPLLWVFASSSESQAFYGGLVLIVWLISFFFGGAMIPRMVRINDSNDVGPVKIWLGIFLLVLLQTSTSLRPLIGQSDDFLPERKLFFLEHWSGALLED